MYSLYNSMDLADDEHSVYLNERGYRLISMVRAIFRLKKMGCEKIVTNYFSYNILNIILSYVFRYNAVVQEHASFYYGAKYKRFLKVIFYRFADKLVILNNFDARVYEKFGIDCVVIPNFCEDVSFDYASLPKANKDSYFLIISRIDANKRVELAIKAYLEYRQMGGVSKLIIAGDGPLKNLIQSKYQSCDVKFVGVSSDPITLIMKSKCILLSSKLECLPTTIIEAKHCGRPVIAFNRPSGITELIDDEVNGYLINGDNVEEFADAMFQLDDDSILENMCKKSFDSKTPYTKDVVTSYYRKILLSD